MTSLPYYNNLVALNEHFYESHRNLLERVLIHLDMTDRIDEVVDTFLDNKFKLKAKKDPNKPTKNRSGYTFFSNDHRKVLKKNSGGKKLHFGTMNKQLGEAWGKLSDKKKKKYIDLAAKDLERYQGEMETYNSNLNA